MLIFIVAKTAFEKIQHPFMIKKSLNKVSTEWMCINIIKAIYDMFTANIILKNEKLKAFLLRSWKRQGCSPLPQLFNLVLEVLARQLGNKKK